MSTRTVFNIVGAIVGIQIISRFYLSGQNFSV